MSTHETQTTSLLWPGTIPERIGQNAHERLARDLNLNALTRHLVLDSSHTRLVEALLLHFTMEPEVIRYRQAVIADLLAAPDLLARLEGVLNTITGLEQYLRAPQWQENELRRVAWRLSELAHYVDAITELDEVLSAAPELQSRALLDLREDIHAIAHDETFVRLREELPALLPQIRNVSSITIGLNLDSDLRPLSATLLSVHSEHFKGASFMARFFSRGKEPDSDEQQGLAELHSARRINFRGRSLEVDLSERDGMLLPPIYHDLAHLLEQTSKPIARALKQYINISGRFLSAVKNELAFYLGAVRLIQHWRACGLPVCRPAIAPADERHCHVAGLYNVNLALHLAPPGKVRDLSGEVVGNDVRFDDETGRIFILTGPNRGGKTTYTQAIGLTQLLFQAGCYVPGTAARLSPVDHIYTHFATEERPEMESGRLGEEAQRLSAIFAHATPHSLILMNESLASTAVSESYYLARDVVRVMRRLGVRAIFATHLLELAHDADALNANEAGNSRVVSLVSRVTTTDDGETVHRTYQIVPAPPLERSYASQIAAKYGLSYDQLVAQLQDRALLE